MTKYNMDFVTQLREKIFANAVKESNDRKEAWLTTAIRLEFKLTWALNYLEISNRKSYEELLKELNN